MQPLTDTEKYQVGVIAAEITRVQRAIDKKKANAEAAAFFAAEREADDDLVYTVAVKR
jgi:hypothetical protein